MGYSLQTRHFGGNELSRTADRNRTNKPPKKKKKNSQIKKQNASKNKYNII